MVNKIFALFGGVFFALMLAGCTTTPEKKQEYDARCKFPGTQELAPEWICKPQYPGYAMVERDAAEKTKAGYSFQEQTAISAARVKLATRLEVTVNDMFDDFTRTTGAGASETVDMAKRNVSRQTASGKLIGSRVLETLQGPDGKVWVLMGMDAKSVQDFAKSAMDNTSNKNDQALWQQFLADKAQAELAAEVKK